MNEIIIYLFIYFKARKINNNVKQNKNWNFEVGHFIQTEVD